MTTIVLARENEKCYQCGKKAQLVLVADTTDPETGYRDELVLCKKCYKTLSGVN